METGEVWAYRARWLDPLVGVEVLRHGTKKPARVLVRFVDPDFEGREAWVPPGRLKVFWSEVAEFIADEARWEAVTAKSPRDTPEASAAWLVFDLVMDEEWAVLESYRAPYLRVFNAQALADWLGWPPSDLRSHPAAFDSDGGELISPWTTAMAVARRSAELSPAKLLDYVDKEERDVAREAIYGHRHASSGKRSEWPTDTERWIEVDNQNGRAVRNLLRTWCGAETVTEREELNALWHEIRRVGQVAEEAIEALRAAGRAGNADRLRTKLDTSVDTLRARD